MAAPPLSAWPLLVFMEKSEVPGHIWHPSDESYSPVWYFSDIEKVENAGKGYNIRSKNSTTKTFLWLPPGNGSFIVPTRSGIHDHVTGMPLETVGDRAEAKRRWMLSGLSDIEAEREISCFFREMPEGARYGITCSMSGDESGPLGISIKSVGTIKIIMLECD